jgi:S1-C subfamily serine protease
VTRLSILGAGIVGILLVGLTLRGLVGQSAGVAPVATLDPNAALQRAILATVQVLTPEDGSSDKLSSGSGTVINGEKGYILTNFHVVGDPETGAYANDQKLAWIALSPNGFMQPPKVRYRAEVAAADHKLDLALLRIVALSDGGRLPAKLGLTAIPVGDSASVTIGDAVTVLGYPGLGGATITLTRGTVSGFVDGWIKTDAETNPGNSGGAAIDADGNLIGVPSAGYYENDQTSDRLPGKLGLIRPINAAQALLKEAR